MQVNHTLGERESMCLQLASVFDGLTSRSGLLLLLHGMGSRLSVTLLKWSWEMDGFAGSCESSKVTAVEQTLDFVVVFYIVC